MNLDVERQARSLRERIGRAFASVPAPSRKKAIGHGSLDERWCADRLHGESRKEIPAEEIFAMSECLLFVSPEVVLYLLPRFLNHPLEPDHRDDASTLHAVLDYLNCQNKDIHPSFSTEQHSCIVDWLKFVHEHSDAFDLGAWRKRHSQLVRTVYQRWSANNCQQ